MADKISIKFRSSAYRMLKKMPGKLAFIFAEFIDNSISSYLQNREKLEKINGKDFKLQIVLDYNDDDEIRILITTIFNIRLFPEEIYFLSQMPSEINLGYITIIFLFSLLITFLATLFPSIAAAKLDPVKALKYE